MFATSRVPWPKPELAAEVRADLVARLRRDVEDVADLCAEIGVSLWRNFA